MADTNQSTPQVPGSDVLLDTLRRSSITDDQRQKIWDAYHVQGDEKAFVKSLNTLTVDDDTKQALYDMRFKGFKNLPTNTPSSNPLQVQGQAQNPDKQNLQGQKESAESNYQKLNGNGAHGSSITADYNSLSNKVQIAIGNLVPNAAMPALSYIQKQILEPFEYAGKVGGYTATKIAQQTASQLLAKPGDVDRVGPSALVEQAKQTHPGTMGIVSGLAGLAGETAGNPENWPFALEGAAKSAISKLAAKGFGVQMIHSAVTALPEVREAIKNGDDYNAARLITTAVAAGFLGSTSLAHGFSKEVPTQSGPQQVSTPGITSTPSLEQRTGHLTLDMNVAPKEQVPTKLANTEVTKSPDVSQIIAPKVEGLPTLTDEQRAIISKAAADAVAKKQAVTGGSKFSDPAHQAVVEQAGGVYRGSFGGNVEVTLPRTLTENVESVPAYGKDFVSVTIPQEQLTVENVKQRMSDKLREFAAPKATETTQAIDSIQPPQKTFEGKADKIESQQIAEGPVKEAWKKQNLDYELQRLKEIIRNPQATPEELSIAHAQLNDLSEQAQTKPVQAEAQPEAPKPAQVQTITPPPVGPEIPDRLQNLIESLPTARRKVLEKPEGSPDRDIYTKKLTQLKSDVAKGVNVFVNRLGSESAGKLRDNMLAKAETFDKQADEVQRIIKQDPIAEAMRADMRTGQAAKSPAGGITIIGATHADIRSVMHEMLGDETQKKFDEIALNQRGKLREQGIDPDKYVPEGYRSASIEEYKAIQDSARKELAELQVSAKKKIADIAANDVAHNPSKVMDVGEDEYLKTAQAKALNQVWNELQPDGKKLKDKVKELRDLIGRDPARSLYLKKGAPVIDEGVIKHPGAIAEKTLELARQIWGTKLEKIPSPAEWDQKVNDLKSMAAMHRLIADAAGKRIEAVKNFQKGQEGFASVAGRPLKADEIAVPKTEDLAKKARKLNYDVREVSSDTPGFDRAWLSPDGKTSIQVPLDEEHDSVAHHILGGKSDWGLASGANSTEAMLKAGWTRKANFNSYQGWRFTPTQIDAIEHDAITNGRFSKAMVLEQAYKGKYESIDIDPGWEDLKSAFAKAIRHQDRYEIGDESGFADLKQMAAMGGASTGALLGYSVGGPSGAIIGGGIGYAAGLGLPNIVKVPALFRKSLNNIGGMLNTSNLSLKDWYFGKAQNPAINPEMKGILEAQSSDLRGPSMNLVDKISKLPGTILQKFDPLIFVNDRIGRVAGRILLNDERGKAFRDLKGKLSIDESPYVAAVNAVGGGSGAGEVHLLAYKNIFKEASDGRLLNNLYEYLNLKGYQRVWDVLKDRIWTHDTNINDLQQKLYGGGITDIRERIQLEDQLKSEQKAKQDLTDRMAKGELTPANYDPAKIQQGLQNLQQGLSLADYTKVEAWGKRVFALHSKILDILHDSGIVGDEDYQTYKQRGDEYIPMHRILDDISQEAFRRGGDKQLYLKQQNVIKALIGSERVNRNPIVASADANLEALREVARNNTAKSFIQLAKQDPNGVGTYFKEVPTGYTAKRGEAVIGVYENGKPQHYLVPDWLGITLNHASPVSLDTASGAMLRFFKQTIQTTATVGNLRWSLPNAVRHLGDMVLMSKAGVDFLEPSTIPGDILKIATTWASSLKDTLQKNQNWQDYVQSGAAFSTLQRQLTPERFLDPNELGKAPNWRTRILGPIEDFNRAIEDTTKLTTFKILKQEGYTDKAAAFETRRYGGGPDFARMGTASNVINQYVMFFNAHLQYLNRAFARVGENPHGMGLKLMAMTALGMSLNQHNWQFTLPNGKPQMTAVPYTDRENNFVILTGNTYKTHDGSLVPQYYKIPKPSFKFLYNPVETLLNSTAGRETRTGTQLTLDTLSGFGPSRFHIDENAKAKTAFTSALSSLNPAISVPFEEAMGMDSNGRPIVPMREQKMAPEFQFGPSTPAVYRQMGEGGMKGATAGGTLGGTLGGVIAGGPGVVAGTGIGVAAGAMGISPRYLQHFVQGTTAGVGETVASMGDILSKTNRNDFPFQGQEATRHIPGVGILAGSVIGSPVNQADLDAETKFYQQSQSVIQVRDTFEALKRKDPQQATDYLQKNIVPYRAGVVATELQKKVGTLNQAIAQAQSNPNLLPDQRITTLTNLHQTKMKLIQTFTDLLRSLSDPGRKSPESGMGPGPTGWNK